VLYDPETPHIFLQLGLFNFAWQLNICAMLSRIWRELYGQIVKFWTVADNYKISLNFCYIG